MSGTALKRCPVRACPVRSPAGVPCPLHRDDYEDQAAIQRATTLMRAAVEAGAVNATAQHQPSRHE